MAYDSGGSDRLLNTVGQVAGVLRVWQDAAVAAISRPEVQEMIRTAGRVAGVVRVWQDAAVAAISRPEVQEMLKAAGRVARVLYASGHTPDEILRLCSVDLLREMRLEVRRLRDAYVELGNDCDVGIAGAEADRDEVIRQLDSFLSSLATTAEDCGVCWGCGDASLTPTGATCERCLGVAAEMMLEAHLLIEGSGGELNDAPAAPSRP